MLNCEIACIALVLWQTLAENVTISWEGQRSVCEMGLFCFKVLKPNIS